MDRQEKFTLHVDSFNQSANSFQVFVNIPLKTVVKAEVLSLSLSSNTTVANSNIAYMIIDELTSRYNDKTLPSVVESIYGSSDPFNPTNYGNTASTYQPYTTSNISNMQRAFLKFDLDPINKATKFYLNSNYPTDTEYVQPIQQLDKMTVSIYDERGVPIVTNGPTYISMRFHCARDNMYKY
jgi:hypothetical protein